MDKGTEIAQNTAVIMKEVTELSGILILDLSGAFLGYLIGLRRVVGAALYLIGYFIDGGRTGT